MLIVCNLFACFDEIASTFRQPLSSVRQDEAVLPAAYRVVRWYYSAVAPMPLHVFIRWSGIRSQVLTESANYCDNQSIEVYYNTTFSGVSNYD